jgi:signal transduction histidine kinase
MAALWYALRTRLALSHAIPVLVVVPVLGLALIYQLERYYLLENVVVELTAQGAIIAEFARDEPVLWQNPRVAQIALEQLQQRIGARLMLVNRNGIIIAASWFDEQSYTGQRVDSGAVHIALQGQAAWAVANTTGLAERAIDVAVPVLVPRQGLLGVIRLAQSMQEIQDRLAPVRWLVLGTIVVGAGLALALGLLLARSLSAPLLALTRAVSNFTPLAPPEAAPEAGPTELRTLSAAFNRMSQRLYDLERSRAALLTGVVHELGRPLGSVKAAAQTIRKSQNIELAQELAGGINVQVDQLRLHLNDLILLGEVEVQGLAIQIEPVDLETLLHDQFQQFAAIAAEKELSLRMEVPSSLPLIHADPKRLGQIMGNLLHNACKYTPAGGQVTLQACFLAATEAPPTIEVRVQDSGPGIEVAEQERIFQLFYRSPSQQRIHEGLGIGLALARQLAHAHNGALTVKSQPGAGATFILQLPADPLRSIDKPT